MFLAKGVITIIKESRQSSFILHPHQVDTSFLERLFIFQNTNDWLRESGNATILTSLVNNKYRNTKKNINPSLNSDFALASCSGLSYYKKTIAAAPSFVLTKSQVS